MEITQVSEEDLKRLAEEQGLTLAAYAIIQSRAFTFPDAGYLRSFSWPTECLWLLIPEFALGVAFVVISIVVLLVVISSAVPKLTHITRRHPPVVNGRKWRG